MIEQVITENDYYDGPKGGVALFLGVPHRFSAEFDETHGEHFEIFLLWPINEADLCLEIEQWNIFVAWNDRYEAGTATTKTHPGHGGIDPRWDEIEEHLTTSRLAPRDHAIRAQGTFEQIARDTRYTTSGLSYGVVWTVISGAA